MHRSKAVCRFLVLVVTLAAGCGRGDGPELAETVGVVNYKGKPLSDANVTFMPNAGPAAYASTDTNGAFSLTTSGEKGAMVGAGTFVISAYEKLAEQKPEDKLTAADIKKMNTSLIPTKYGRPESSGLNETIKPGVKNEFTFDLE